jgi:hypothetical protein
MISYPKAQQDFHEIIIQILIDKKISLSHEMAATYLKLLSEGKFPAGDDKLAALKEMLIPILAMPVNDTPKTVQDYLDEIEQEALKKEAYKGTELNNDLGIALGHYIIQSIDQQDAIKRQDGEQGYLEAAEVDHLRGIYPIQIDLSVVGDWRPDFPPQADYGNKKIDLWEQKEGQLFIYFGNFVKTYLPKKPTDSDDGKPAVNYAQEIELYNIKKSTLINELSAKTEISLETWETILLKYFNNNNINGVVLNDFAQYKGNSFQPLSTSPKIRLCIPKKNDFHLTYDIAFDALRNLENFSQLTRSNGDEELFLDEPATEDTDAISSSSPQKPFIQIIFTYTPSAASSKKDEVGTIEIHGFRSYGADIHLNQDALSPHNSEFTNLSRKGKMRQSIKDFGTFMGSIGRKGGSKYAAAPEPSQPLNKSAIKEVEGANEKASASKIKNLFDSLRLKKPSNPETASIN